jgi:class 3 adenylate cyclase
MGSIGAPSQMNFGMVGDAVNTAHRLVELAQHGEIIVTQTVVESLNGEMEDWTFERLSPVYIKGKGLPVQAFRAHFGRSEA